MYNYALMIIVYNYFSGIGHDNFVMLSLSTAPIDLRDKEAVFTTYVPLHLISFFLITVGVSTYPAQQG